MASSSSSSTFDVVPDFDVGSRVRCSGATFRVVTKAVPFGERQRGHRPSDILSSLDTLPNLDTYVGWMKKEVGSGFKNFVAYIVLNKTGHILCREAKTAAEVYGRLPALLRLARRHNNASGLDATPFLVDPEWFETTQTAVGVADEDDAGNESELESENDEETDSSHSDKEEEEEDNDEEEDQDIGSARSRLMAAIMPPVEIGSVADMARIHRDCASEFVLKKDMECSLGELRMAACLLCHDQLVGSRLHASSSPVIPYMFAPALSSDADLAGISEDIENGMTLDDDRVAANLSARGNGVSWSISYATQGGIVGSRAYTVSQLMRVVFYAYYFVVGLAKHFEQVADAAIAQNPVGRLDVSRRAAEFVDACVVSDLDIQERYFLCSVIARAAIGGEEIDLDTRLILPPLPGLVLREYVDRPTGDLETVCNCDLASAKTVALWLLVHYREGVSKIVEDSINKHGIVCIGSRAVSHVLKSGCPVPWTLVSDKELQLMAARLPPKGMPPLPAADYCQLHALAPVVLDFLVYNHCATTLCPGFMKFAQKISPDKVDSIVSIARDFAETSDADLDVPTFMGCVVSMLRRQRALQEAIVEKVGTQVMELANTCDATLELVSQLEAFVSIVA